MCLDIEPRGFHSSKSRLDLPAFLIGQNGFFGTVETSENLKFRHTIGVFDSATGKIDIFAFMKEEFVVEFLLPGSEVIEQPPCTDSLTGRGLVNPEVLPYAYIIPYASVVEPANPFLSDELAVGDKAVYAVLYEKADEAFHEFPLLLPIGIAPFRKKTENQWECNAFIGYTQHKDIEFSELPVGAVYAEHKTVSEGENQGRSVRAVYGC